MASLAPVSALMRRASRQRLWLASAVLLLTVLAWWTVRKQPAADPETLLPVAPAAITRVDVRAVHGDLRRFQKRDGVWWMSEPRQARADPAHLERLTEIAAARVLRWRPMAQFDPAKIGLDRPFAVLHLDGQKLTFGGLAALAPQRYVQRGDHVALIPAQYAADLAASVDAELAKASSAEH